MGMGGVFVSLYLLAIVIGIILLLAFLIISMNFMLTKIKHDRELLNKVDHLIKVIERNNRL